MIAIVSLFPIGKEASLSRYVAQSLKMAEKSGLDYRLTSMGTIIEGEWEPVMKLVKKMRDELLKKSQRVYLTISIDDRKGPGKRLDAKVRKIESLLGKSLKK